MHRLSGAGRLLTGAVVCLTVLFVAPAASARPSVAPLTAQPHGLSYDEWGARWYQWALGTPVSENPFAGADCSGGQTGHVWFLHGVFGAGEAQRTCSVPTGAALFFPLLNNAYFAFLNDSPETRTEDFVRAMATCDADSVAVSIDGIPVRDADRYYVDARETSLFDVQLPANNILGLTEEDAEDLLLSPSAHSGYYLFLHPLPPGTHTIEWHAGGECGLPDAQQDISYTIEVVPGRRL